ncbi:tyrosine-type recombinase/integrase [Nocardioides sp. QY071]|uniref:tyrosine-type recombinase/integrase n=1 Tax=Nocardioides sp. QY071 TaxID=3044187 RepID=UPI00249BB91F|nr:tyrosine-type recombinase/integrase [Nocardioides sp. QY071]WGY02912.1 tyrosine-type recombinase/integrase [Nocardioides sp. QY071]
MPGRPRTPVGAFGVVNVRRTGRLTKAETRIRDADGRVRRVTASAATAAAARQRLHDKLRTRPAFGRGGTLSADSPFPSLVALWLEDLDLQDLAEGTKESYRDLIRLHVLPAFEHFMLGEITTGRVEWFLKSQLALSYSRAMHSRSILNLLFGFALRNDALARNPVEGTSQLRKPKNSPQALTLEQVAAIRKAAAEWRTAPGLPGPKSDGQVRDLIELLLGTGMRPGEALALRPCDVRDTEQGMVVRVTGTVVLRKATGLIRQAHPKTASSVRDIPVPEFAAVVIRRRMRTMRPDEGERTIFANRTGGVLNPYNVRRTFREMVELAGLGDTGISLRWYRRTAATVIARGLGTDAAATFLGHTSSAITEGHYIEPDPTTDHAPAAHLERALRPTAPVPDALDTSGAFGEQLELEALFDVEEEAEGGDADA